MYYIQINKNFVRQVGDQTRLCQRIRQNPRAMQNFVSSVLFYLNCERLSTPHPTHKLDTTSYRPHATTYIIHSLLPSIYLQFSFPIYLENAEAAAQIPAHAGLLENFPDRRDAGFLLGLDAAPGDDPMVRPSR